MQFNTFLSRTVKFPDVLLLLNSLVMTLLSTVCGRRVIIFEQLVHLRCAKLDVLSGNLIYIDLKLRKKKLEI